MSRIEFFSLEKKRCSQCGNMHNVSSIYVNKKKGNLWCVSCLALEKKKREHQQWKEKKKKKVRKLKEDNTILKNEIGLKSNIENIECRCCKENTKKRVVLTQEPLTLVVSNLQNGYKEFCCSNKIKTLRSLGRDESGKKIHKWFEEICENHILIRKNNKKKIKTIVEG